VLLVTFGLGGTKRSMEYGSPRPFHFGILGIRSEEIEALKK